MGSNASFTSPPPAEAGTPYEAARPPKLWWIAGIFVISVLGIWLLHPRISIPDVDAHASILGAHSLKRGHGYRDLHGAPLNHWPPGYSLLLSLAPQPVMAAQIINYLAFGGAVTMLFLLALRTGWPAPLAGSFAVAFGFGLLRLLACMSKPDILTFFVFLLAAKLFHVEHFRFGRLLACFLWGALIPLKLIAVVFVPGVLLADWWMNGNRHFWARFTQHASAGAFWLLFAGATLAFNYFTIYAWNSPSYVDPSIMGLINELKRFVSGFFVGILAVWYGPIQQPRVATPVVATVWLGLAALSTVKTSPRGKPLLGMGIGILVISWLLEIVRLYYADARLMGYGILLVLVGLAPGGRFAWLWTLYAFGTLALAIYNVATTVSVGTNHSAYADVARRIAATRLPEGPIVSNSFHILDVHAGIPTRPVTSLDTVPRGTIYVEITLPNYDAIAKTVGPAAAVDSSWREIASVEGARIYQKVEGEVSGELPPGELRVIY